MKCPRCGFEDPAIRPYCPVCGARLDMTTGEHIAVLSQEKKREREQRVFATLVRWFAGAAALLVVLFALKSAFSTIPREAIAAYFPPPQVDIAEPQKLSITPTSLPIPDTKPIRYGRLDKKEDEVIAELLNEVMEQAPRYRVGGPDGEIIRGFILSRHGDSAIFFTAKGKQVVSTKGLTPLD
jgi:predicted nucleic acid-binding Zn ribbon protein